ncbi:MAG: GNAT family N-acetyltransferase [Gemmatimonadaceae bacterium]|nr:GNAT family N-acetyltransferase [Gemmatimonadaceae bacterium]
MSAAAPRWRALAAGEVDAWNARLLRTRASLFQFPYWNEPLRFMRFVPHYLVYEEEGCALAYACVLAFGVGVRVGLVQRGPVPLDGDTLPPHAARDLARWAQRRGFVFLRITHSDPGVLAQVGALRAARACDAFPFYREPPEELLVAQDGTDDEVLARFQAQARRHLRKGERVGYTIEASATPDAMRAAWGLFQGLAQRKGFNYRPLESFTTLLRLAAPHGGARVYTASLDGTLVQAILVVRDGLSAHYVAGALDIDALGGRDSPSVLLHWRAMRDFARESVRTYDLGTRSGPVYQFKRKFHPVEIRHPEPITVVTNPVLYAAWSVVGLRLVLPHWRQIKRVAARALGGARAATANGVPTPHALEG